MYAAGFKQIINIGLGEPKHAERYCGKLAPSYPCFAATSNKPYYLWGLQHGTAGDYLSNAGKLLTASVKALAACHVQGENTGDPQMLPGTFIVDAAGIIRYTYYSKIAGDDPTIEALVAAMKAIAG